MCVLDCLTIYTNLRDFNKWEIYVFVASCFLFCCSFHGVMWGIRERKCELKLENTCSAPGVLIISLDRCSYKKFVAARPHESPSGTKTELNIKGDQFTPRLLLPAL